MSDKPMANPDQLALLRFAGFSIDLRADEWYRSEDKGWRYTLDQALEEARRMAIEVEDEREAQR